MPRRNKRPGSKFGAPKRIDPEEFGVKRAKPQKIQPTPTSIRNEAEQKRRQAFVDSLKSETPTVMQELTSQDGGMNKESKTR